MIPVVKDDKCSPVEYKSGDTHNIGKIDQMKLGYLAVITM